MSTGKCFNSYEFQPQVSQVQSPDTFTDINLKSAFRVTLLNSEGKPQTERMELLWERSVHLTRASYRIPGGSVGRRFTSLLAKEILLLAQAKEKLERCSVFES